MAALSPAQAGWPWAGTWFGAAQPVAPPVAEWSYAGATGPAHWAELAPEYAACKGRSQSPVELGGARPAPYVPLAFQYQSRPLHIVNDGRQIRVRYPPGSSLLVRGRRYELVEFHVHAPGEHRIAGIPPDLEFQLHHRDHQGRLAIVAILGRAGHRPNSTLQRIVEHLPPLGGESYYGRQVGINPLFLLPSRREYFRYAGSLTEPPCTEGAEWFVLSTPLEVEAAVLHHFHRVLENNARPVQPLHGRPVLAVRP